MAPEVLNAERYNERVDVFSFAIMAWELCSLQQLYEARQVTKDLLAGLKGWTSGMAPPGQGPFYLGETFSLADVAASEEVIEIACGDIMSMAGKARLDSQVNVGVVLPHLWGHPCLP